MVTQDHIAHDNGPKTVLLTDEKTVFPASEDDSSPNGSITARTTDWTPEEERHLVRKFVYTPRFKWSHLNFDRLDRIVMPLLMLAFGALQYDRGNMYANQTSPVILS
jgi:hypothetical protein